MNVFGQRLPTVNLTAIGLMYVITGVTQTWFWFQTLYQKHPTWVPHLFDKVVSGPVVSQMSRGILAFYMLCAWWVAITLVWIGGKIVFFGLSKKVVIKQEWYHAREAWMAVIFLLVSLLICFWFVPSAQPRPETEAIFIALMGFMMMSYGFLAILKYRGVGS